MSLSPSQLRAARGLLNWSRADLAKRSDARMVVATNQDLNVLQTNGRFRKDLYYRLCDHHLHIPPLRSGFVCRDRLIARLNEGLASGRRLSLISAPAGFGKTTLVSEWIATFPALHAHSFLGKGVRVRVAWLSLDESDSDLTRFLLYFVSAVQTVAPDFGQGMLAVLQASQVQPPVDALLTTLLNELAAIPDRFILVLDDYHTLDCKPIDEALTFLVDHLPPRMQLVITTREDPQLPLARLRARSQLTELRAVDLRFTPDEAAEFLNHTMGLGLSADNVAALEVRTEGWIAGLQLAALSMQGRSDAAGFIESFTGSHRFVLDYLVEQVLESQPAGLQEFLMRTSILERLSEFQRSGKADLGNVKVEVKGQKISVAGPKGKLDMELPRRTSIKMDAGKLVPDGLNFCPMCGKAAPYGGSPSAEPKEAQRTRKCFGCGRDTDPRYVYRETLFTEPMDALASVGGKENARFIERVIIPTCREPLIIPAAIEALGRIGDKESIRVLERLRPQHPDLVRDALEKIEERYPADRR